MVKKKGTTKKSSLSSPSITSTSALSTFVENEHVKKIFLIRHGESIGQAAKTLGLNRKSSPELLDAGLTQKGKRQASSIPNLLGPETLSSIDVIITSPLTRAFHTTMLGFGYSTEAVPIIVDYNIREIGSALPENQGRGMEQIYRDLRVGEEFAERVDYDSRKPEGWPNSAQAGGLRRGERVKAVVKGIAEMEDVRVVAVVCHHNVIQSILGPQVKPKNATPIECELDENGTIRLAT